MRSAPTRTVRESPAKRPAGLDDGQKRSDASWPALVGAGLPDVGSECPAGMMGRRGRTGRPAQRVQPGEVQAELDEEHVITRPPPTSGRDGSGGRAGPRRGEPRGGDRRGRRPGVPSAPEEGQGGVRQEHDGRLSVQPGLETTSPSWPGRSRWRAGEVSPFRRERLGSVSNNAFKLTIRHRIWSTTSVGARPGDEPVQVSCRCAAKTFPTTCRERPPGAVPLEEVPCTVPARSLRLVRYPRIS